MKWNKKYNLTTKIAYIAGFIDGEGCIRIKKSNKQGNSYYVTVAISSNTMPPLTFIKDGFGGKIYKKEKGFQYYIASGEAVDLLRIIFNYLIIKKAEAELAIEFYDLYKYMDAVTKQSYCDDMRRLKHIVPVFIGKIYENPELLGVKK